MLTGMDQLISRIQLTWVAVGGQKPSYDNKDPEPEFATKLLPRART